MTNSCPGRSGSRPISASPPKMNSRMLRTGIPIRTATTVCAASCATIDPKNSKLVTTLAAQIAGHVTSGATPAATLASINRRGINDVARRPRHKPKNDQPAGVNVEFRAANAEQPPQTERRPPATAGPLLGPVLACVAQCLASDSCAQRGRDQRHNQHQHRQQRQDRPHPPTA